MIWSSSLGATEPHNLHLPYLTDCILSHDIALDAAKLAKTHYGIRCMVMPYVTAGSQNRDNASWISASIIAMKRKRILSDIVASLYAQGIPQNGHYQRTWRQYIQKYDT